MTRPWIVRLCRVKWLGAAMFVLLCVQLATAQPAPVIHIGGYRIEVTLDPARHSMDAQSAVTFTAVADAPEISFHLNPALRVNSVIDAAGIPLHIARDGNSIHVAPSSPLPAGSSATWTFTYSGVFAPVNAQATRDGIPSLAAIGDPVTYLLYAAQWFPLVGDGTQRFSAAMQVHIPAGERVFGSGLIAAHPEKNGGSVFSFAWKQPGFPGTLIAGKFREPFTAGNIHLDLLQNTNGIDGQKLASTAAQQYRTLRSQFGPLGEQKSGAAAQPASTNSSQLDVIELPNNTVPAYAAPGIVAIASGQLRTENASRLLANTMAHQWWGNLVSPQTRNDAWITNGMCRYAE
ncbi:MAG: peptidase M1, partial [Acidobacteriaceae bacterium]